MLIFFICALPLVLDSLSRLRERAGVRERLPLLAGSTLTPPAGEGIEAGEVNPFPSGLLSFPRWGKAGMGAYQP